MQAGRREVQVSEYLGVGLEAGDGAAPVDIAQVFQLADGMAAFEAELVGLFFPGDFDFHPFRQGIDDAGAHAMQATRRVIGLAVEFAAGMERGHDDLQRRLVLEFGMRIDGNAAAIVADHQHIVRLQLQFDAGGVTGHRLVHRIVDDLGRQVMQRVGIGAPDIHAGPAPHGLQALQHFDILGGIGLGGGGGAVEQVGIVFGHGGKRGSLVNEDTEIQAESRPGRPFLLFLNQEKRAKSHPLRKCQDLSNY